MKLKKCGSKSRGSGEVAVNQSLLERQESVVTDDLLKLKRHKRHTEKGLTPIVLCIFYEFIGLQQIRLVAAFLPASRHNLLP